MTFSILTITASFSYVLIVQCTFKFRYIQMQFTYNWSSLMWLLWLLYQNKISVPELTSVSWDTVMKVRLPVTSLSIICFGGGGWWVSECLGLHILRGPHRPPCHSKYWPDCCEMHWCQAMRVVNPWFHPEQMQTMQHLNQNETVTGVVVAQEVEQSSANCEISGSISASSSHCCRWLTHFN